MAKKIRIAVAIILLAIAALSAWQLWDYQRTSAAAEDVFQALRISAADEAFVGAGDTSYALPSVAALREENSDAVAWVYVEGTRINYPVMQTPDSEEFYLRKDFNRDYSLSGTPFMDARCGLDADELIVYGHNMKSGTMFADLLQFKDADYFQAHRNVYLATADGVRRYEIVAAFPTVAQDEGTYLFWHDQVYFEDEAAFHSFAAVLESVSLFALPADNPLSSGDRFLTLATCAYHAADGRFVLVAREVTSQ
ncbi:MAG: class B sortase [Oscillospiraceae bacterium]|nr:class B sortase [Oscillospiraceae bacterium]